MPIKRCQRDNKKGFKFGEAGYCFIGPDALEKAKRQGRAIEAGKVKR